MGLGKSLFHKNADGSIEPDDGRSITADNDATELRGKKTNGVYQVGDGKRYDSITAAHAALPSSGGVISYDGTYDPSNETFPIELSKPHVLIGNQVTPITRPKGDGKVIDLTVSRSSGHPPNGWRWDNVLIEKGGDSSNGVPAVDIRGRWGVIANSIIRDAQGLGVRFTKNTNLLTGSTVEDCGGDGVYITDTANNVVLSGCIIQFNSSIGVRFHNIAASNVYQSAIQDNDGIGVFIAGGTNCGVKASYIENNDSSNNEEVALEQYGSQAESDAHYFENCYFNGEGNTHHAVEQTYGRKLSYKHCTFANYTSYGIVVGGGQDTEVSHETNELGSSTPTLVSDSGTRTRSNGVILEQNLSGVTGQYTGDMGMDDGTNTGNSNPDICVWTGSNWREIGTTTTFT